MLVYRGMTRLYTNIYDNDSNSAYSDLSADIASTRLYWLLELTITVTASVNSPHRTSSTHTFRFSLASQFSPKLLPLLQVGLHL